MNMNMDNARAINSAAGVASQMPFTPKIAGSRSMVASMNTKEREKARIAETMPLESDVNIPLAKILNPMKNRAMLQMRFPVTANPYTGFSGRAKIDTNGFVAEIDTATVNTEITAIVFKLVDTSFFNFS